MDQGNDHMVGVAFNACFDLKGLDDRQETRGFSQQSLLGLWPGIVPVQQADEVIYRGLEVVLQCTGKQSMVRYPLEQHLLKKEAAVLMHEFDATRLFNTLALLRYFQCLEKRVLFQCPENIDSCLGFGFGKSWNKSLQLAHDLGEPFSQSCDLPIERDNRLDPFSLYASRI